MGQSQGLPSIDTHRLDRRYKTHGSIPLLELEDIKRICRTKWGSEVAELPKNCTEFRQKLISPTDGLEAALGYDNAKALVYDEIEKKMVESDRTNLQLKYSNDDLMDEPKFFDQTLPFIYEAAVALPLLFPDGLAATKQLEPKEIELTREQVLCLMANMFLCNFDHLVTIDGLKIKWDAFNMISFRSLFGQTFPQEVAKLRMFLNYFERARNSDKPGTVISTTFQGKITITRQVRLQEKDDINSWKCNTTPLGDVAVREMFVPFEHEAGMVEADFANMYIGGGVFSGGCIQEEIRFSICPENCVAMLVCPVMLGEEAIHIHGAEQFSEYVYYAFKLQYGGNHVNKTYQTSDDGTVLVAIGAMDAIDFRKYDSSILAQLKKDCLLREMNKALAAFDVKVPTLANDVDVGTPKLSTGNWGSGGFEGCAHLKAVLQYAVASRAEKTMVYFPFDQGFGTRLRIFVERCKAQKKNVGDLVNAMINLRWNARLADLSHAETFFSTLEGRMGLGSNGPGCGTGIMSLSRKQTVR